jgi:hypothetical protein
LDGEESEFEVYFMTADRKKYTQFSQLDWYFAQPRPAEGLPVIQAVDFNVLTSDDWYFSPDRNAPEIISMYDSLFDDTGLNGNYTYPLNPAFSPGIFDIRQFRIHDLGEKWGFVIDMRDLVNPNWHPEYGFQLSFLAIAIQNPANKSRGRRAIGKEAFYRLSVQRKFHDIIYVGGGFEIFDRGEKLIHRGLPDNPYQPLGFAGRKQIRFSLDKSILPYLNSETRITILSGGQDDHGGAGIGSFREVRTAAGEWHGGGAESDTGASRIYDILEIN